MISSKTIHRWTSQSNSRREGKAVPSPSLHCKSCCEWKSCSTLRMGRRSSLRSRGVDGGPMKSSEHALLPTPHPQISSTALHPPDHLNCCRRKSCPKPCTQLLLSQSMHNTTAVPSHALVRKHNNCCPNLCTTQLLLSESMHNTTSKTIATHQNERHR